MADRYDHTSALDDFPRYFRESDNGELEDLLKLVHLETSRWTSTLDEISRYRAEDQTATQLRELAVERGISDFPGWIGLDVRQKLWRELPRLYRGKGVAKTLEEAIRLTTQRQAAVEYGWAENRFQIGTLVIGETTLGTGPLTEYDHFVVGAASIGVAALEPQDLSPAYEFVVRLSYEPTEGDLLGILWTLELLRRNVDRYRILWPAKSKYWIVEGSRLSRDTKLAPSTWVIGVGVVGSIAIDGDMSLPSLSLQKTMLDKDTTLPPFNGDGYLP